MIIFTQNPVVTLIGTHRLCRSVGVVLPSWQGWVLRSIDIVSFCQSWSSLIAFGSDLGPWVYSLLLLSNLFVNIFSILGILCDVTVPNKHVPDWKLDIKNSAGLGLSFVGLKAMFCLHCGTALHSSASLWVHSYFISTEVVWNTFRVPPTESLTSQPMTDCLWLVLRSDVVLCPSCFSAGRVLPQLPQRAYSSHQ